MHRKCVRWICLLLFSLSWNPTKRVGAGLLWCSFLGYALVYHFLLSLDSDNILLQSPVASLEPSLTSRVIRVLIAFDVLWLHLALIKCMEFTFYSTIYIRIFMLFSLHRPNEIISKLMFSSLFTCSLWKYSCTLPPLSLPIPSQLFISEYGQVWLHGHLHFHSVNLIDVFLGAQGNWCAPDAGKRAVRGRVESKPQYDRNEMLTHIIISLKSFWSCP